MSRLLIPLTLLIVALVAAPTATAHATKATTDGKFLIVVGYQGEPVYTYQTTGLDLIIRDNATGGGVAGANATLEATLVSPSGEELSLPLAVQHGETSRYQFTEGFVLTEPGLYVLRLSGTINGTDAAGEYPMAHATKPRGDIMFPAEGLDDLDALNARIADLETRLNDLDTNGVSNGDGANEAAAPGPGLLIGLSAIALAFLALRRR